MVTMTEVPDAEAFSAWMAEQVFTAQTLADALGVNRITVWRWQSGAHALKASVWKQCQAAAGGERGRARRVKAAEDVKRAQEKAQEMMRAARARARGKPLR